MRYQLLPPTVNFVENKMCSGNEHKEIKPSTNNKGDSQVNKEDNEIDTMPKDHLVLGTTTGKIVLRARVWSCVGEVGRV